MAMSETATLSTATVRLFSSWDPIEYLIYDWTLVIFYSSTLVLFDFFFSWDPSERLTPEEALQHEWIQEDKLYKSHTRDMQQQQQQQQQHHGTMRSTAALKPKHHYNTHHHHKHHHHHHTKHEQQAAADAESKVSSSHQHQEVQQQLQQKQHKQQQQVEDEHAVKASKHHTHINSDSETKGKQATHGARECF